MENEFKKFGWIGQAVIVAIGSAFGAIFGLLLVPAAVNLHGEEVRQHAIWAWCCASCGAIAGGLLFSWLKDR